jgi:hypothetical protein
MCCVTDLRIDLFEQALSRHSVDQPLTSADMAEAKRNLAGFLEVLLKVNDRVKLVELNPSAALPAPSIPKAKRQRKMPCKSAK